MAAISIDDGIVQRLLTTLLLNIDTQILNAWPGQAAPQSDSPYLRLLRFKIIPMPGHRSDNDADMAEMHAMALMTCPAAQQEGSTYAAASAVAYAASLLRGATLRDSDTGHEVQIERVEREIDLDGGNAGDQPATLTAVLTIYATVKHESGTSVEDHVT